MQSVSLCVTLKKGAMPIPELTSGCIIGDLVVLYIFTPEDRKESERAFFCSTQNYLVYIHKTKQIWGLGGQK